MGKQLGDDMTLSREIVVLDLKDRAQDSAAPTSGAQDEGSLEADGGAQKSPLRSHQPAASLASHTPDQTEAVASSESLNLALQTGNQMHCLSSQSLLLLICSIGLFFVLYVCVVAYFFARRHPKISVIKHQYH